MTTPIQHAKFSKTTCVANCVACTLAPAMMDCSNCPFNVGKAVRVAHLETLRLAEPVLQEQYWATLPRRVWDAYYEYLNNGKGRRIFTISEERQAEAMAGCNW